MYGRGGIGRADGGGRQREGGRDPRTGEPLRLTGTWAQVEDGKGGQPDEGRQTQAHARKLLGCLAGEESADEWWRPAGGGGRPGGRSLHARATWGGRSECKDKENRRQRVKDGGIYDIGPGVGRNGMNDPKKCRINYGAEGLDKSAIDKRQSLRIEQSLTEAQKNLLILPSHCSSRRPVNTHTHTINYWGPGYPHLLQQGGFTRNHRTEFSISTLKAGHPTDH